MSTKLTYTKAIKNGRLSTAKMGVGESVTGTLLGTEQGKYGPVIILNVNGREVKVNPSGNLKLKANSNELNAGSFYTITRKEDATTKSGYPVTQFDIQEGQSTSTTTAPASIKEKLQAIRSNKA